MGATPRLGNFRIPVAVFDVVPVGSELLTREMIEEFVEWLQYQAIGIDEQGSPVWREQVEVQLGPTVRNLWPVQRDDVVKETGRRASWVVSNQGPRDTWRVSAQR